MNDEQAQYVGMLLSRLKQGNRDANAGAWAMAILAVFEGQEAELRALRQERA